MYGSATVLVTAQRIFVEQRLVGCTVVEAVAGVGEHGEDE